MVIGLLGQIGILVVQLVEMVIKHEQGLVLIQHQILEERIAVAAMLIFKLKLATPEHVN